jgi:hypothetical protein
VNAIRDSIVKHAESIAMSVGVAMLVIAANLRESPFWLVAPGWLVLAVVGYLRFNKVPKDSPYKGAFYIMALPLLFYGGLWHTALSRFADVLSQPSAKHIYALVRSPGFLVLAIIYLAAVCLFYGGVVQKRDESIEVYKRALKERADAGVHPSAQPGDAANRALLRCVAFA